jgi:GT2 family glycosyltransferase
MQKADKVSIVILSYNRRQLLRKLLSSLAHIKHSPHEIIVIDNGSEDLIAKDIKLEFPDIVVFEMDENVGAARGRNRGISESSGDIIITLDDDISGIDDKSILKLIEIFKNDQKIAAVCFKILEAGGDEAINWCHHYGIEEFSDKTFVTNEISEGAVAFRKSALAMTGLYPDSYFISHEGADLACRMMNKGFRVIYCPDIIVQHFHSEIGRADWRRYYFDTRNLIWLVVRNYSFMYGFKRLSIGLLAMLVYSIRDGYIRYWLKGIFDGVVGLKVEYKHRNPMTRGTLRMVKDIEKNRPSLLTMARKRLFRRGVKI